MRSYILDTVLQTFLFSLFISVADCVQLDDKLKCDRRTVITMSGGVKMFLWYTWTHKVNGSDEEKKNRR